MKINYLYSIFLKNEVWFVEQNTKILFRFDIGEKALKPMCFLGMVEQENCDYSQIVGYDDDIFLFPGNCKKILKYSISENRLKIIYNCDTEFRCASVLEINGKIVAFSSGYIERPIILDLRTGEITRINMDIIEQIRKNEFSTLSVISNSGSVEYSIYGTNSILQTSMSHIEFKKIDIENDIKIKKMYLCKNRRFVLDIYGKVYEEKRPFFFDEINTGEEYIDAVLTKDGLLFIPCYGGNFIEYNYEKELICERTINIVKRVKNRLGLVIGEELLLSPFYHDDILLVDLNKRTYNVLNPMIDRDYFKEIDIPLVVNEGCYDLESFINRLI